jgi:hypothetical protein
LSHGFPKENSNSSIVFELFTLFEHRLKVERFLVMEKPSLQSKFTILKSKLFPAKIPFSKMQKKNLAGKIYFAKK